MLPQICVRNRNLFFWPHDSVSLIGIPSEKCQCVVVLDTMVLEKSARIRVCALLCLLKSGGGLERE